MSAEKRKRLLDRYNRLKQDRDASWLSHWRELAEHIRPRGFRELASDAATAGKKKHGAIVNSTPLEAARTLASGMMAGITSPSRPWFRFVMSDSRQMRSPRVRQWLREVEDEVREAIAKSNVYKGLHGVYSDLGPFGTGAFWLDEDLEDGLRAYVLPLGSYVLANSSRQAVDTCYRHLTLTVAQLEELFGLAKCSDTVKEQHAACRLDERHEVLHVVEPNREWREGALGWRGKRWVSYWMEMAGGPETGFLRQSGYDEFPVMAPRWETTGEDVYGSGPGMAALGDCRALQHLERRAAQAADKVVDPPMQLPTQLQHGNVGLLPGDQVFVDGLTPQQVVRPALEVPVQAVTVFAQQIAQHAERIRRAFFADLWLSITSSEGQMTAREVVERREEKMLQLGTVLENLQDELLEPLLERCFAILWRQGKLPPPPEELQGVDFDIEYISVMAQAQKLLDTTGLERLAAFVGNVAQVSQEALDNVDLDKVVQAYATALGVPPDTIRPADAIAALRRGRAEAMRQQQQQQQMVAEADAAKKLAGADMDGTNALTEMLRNAGVR